MNGSQRIFCIANQTMFDALRRLRSHIRIPLYGNAYALILSSATTSIFGLLYWILAARIYTTDSVGVNSALIAAMLTLSNISLFSLTNALNRFLPSAGAAAGRIVFYCYLTSLAAALLASSVFVQFVEFWTPALGFLRSNSDYALTFVAATMTCCVFALQDGAFVGLRKAAWVPIENLLFSLMKIALLIAFASMLPDLGIFASWAVSMAVMVIPVNLLIFIYLVPRHAAPVDALQEPTGIPTIVRFVIGDYCASLLGTLPYFLLPLIVLEKFGASANAYYYMSWTMAYSLYLVSQNIGMSLIAEASRSPARLGLYSYRSLVQGARLLLPAVLVLMLAAPYILGLFGPDYATEGTWLFRLLCLSAIPNLIIALFISIVRVQRRMRVLSFVTGVLSVLVLGLSYLLFEAQGIESVGVAWLVSNSIIAAVLVVTRLGRLWLPYVNLRPVVISMGRLRSHWRRQRNQDHIALAARMLPELTARIQAHGQFADARLWTVQRQLASINDVSVVTMGAKGRAPVALLKIAHSPCARESLDKHISVLERLNADPRLKDWNVHLPKILATGEAEEQACLIESYIPGATASQFASSSNPRKLMQQAAIEAIGVLHRSTAQEMALDEAWLKQWVGEPARRIGEHMAGDFDAVFFARSLEQLVEEMKARLLSRQAIVSWTHGDYSFDNILLDMEGRHVIGILDWDRAALNGLPQVDIVLLIISSLMQIRNRELGDVVSELLEDNVWGPDEAALMANAGTNSGAGNFELRELVLLCWLNHVDANLQKSGRYTGSRIWKAKNIALVLHQLPDGIGDPPPKRRQAPADGAGAP